MTMADLRSALEEAMNQAEEAEMENEPIETQETVEEQPRNEKGQFTAKEESEPEEVEASADNETEVQETKPEVSPSPALQRPSTWKKEYLPIWDKLTSGQQLTNEEAIKLAEYSNQREAEYKRGVSTYKTEADNARTLIQAIEPFMPELQANNIHPATWINNLGRAHYLLAKGSPEQKVQMFTKLAQDYGIQLGQNGIESPQYDPNVNALLEQINTLKSEIGSVKGWKEQEEQQRLMSEINRVAQNTEKFPYFDEVREDMAQLLERGLANDLETAYARAVRLNESVWQKEQEKLLNQVKQQASKAQVVAKAKAKAVSPKSVTPNTLVATSDKKDRKSILEAQLSEINSRV